MLSTVYLAGVTDAKTVYMHVSTDLNRYLKGKMYKTVDVGCNKCHIGSTCEEFKSENGKT